MRSRQLRSAAVSDCALLVAHHAVVAGRVLLQALEECQPDGLSPSFRSLTRRLGCGLPNEPRTAAAAPRPISLSAACRRFTANSNVHPTSIKLMMRKG